MGQNGECAREIHREKRVMRERGWGDERYERDGRMEREWREMK